MCDALPCAADAVKWQVRSYLCGDTYIVVGISGVVKCCLVKSNLYCGECDVMIFDVFGVTPTRDPQRRARLVEIIFRLLGGVGGGSVTSFSYVVHGTSSRKPAGSVTFLRRRRYADSTAVLAAQCVRCPFVVVCLCVL